MKTIYKASLDLTAKLVTLGIFLLLVAIAIGPKLLGKSSGPQPMIVASVMLVVVFGFSYLYSPSSYQLNEKELTINRPIGKVVVPRSEIQSVLKIEKGQLRFTIRRFGVGGLFGYFGNFWNKTFGEMTWYATRMDRALLIITNKNKKLLITPDEIDLFIEQLYESDSN